MTAVKDQVRNAEAQAAKARRGLDRDGRRLVAQVGAAVAAPTPERLRKGVALVTDPAQTEVQADGSVKRTPARTGFKAVSKLDTLYARKAVSEVQYEAALTVLHWMEQAQLSAPSALRLIAQTGRAGGSDGWTVARLDALTRLRLLSRQIGQPMMGLLVYILLDEGDLADWPGLAKSTRARREDYRTGAVMALLLIALDRIAEGA